MTPVESKAVGALLAAHRPFILRQMFYFGVRGHDASDAAQDVLLQAFRTWGEYRSEAGTVEAWLLGIIRRIASNWRRTRQRRPAALWEPERLAAIREVKSSPEDAAEHALMVAFCRARTSPVNWRALVAFAVEGLTIEALAEQEGVTKGAIDWRLHVARRELQAAILGYQASGPEDEPHASQGTESAEAPALRVTKNAPMDKPFTAEELAVFERDERRPSGGKNRRRP